MSETQTLPKPGVFKTVLLSRSLAVGTLITVILVAMAVISYVWTPYSPTAMNFRDKLQGPSFSHLFGTDNFGRDVFSMIMVGARNSIAVSIIAVLVCAGIGIPLGALAA
ncbi:MAG TPA: peptide ABC transporter permease, partial [Ochrobactrum anthropi]|nr:peptide ABC transporter permease [Brucella anthropi]